MSGTGAMCCLGFATALLLCASTALAAPQAAPKPDVRIPVEPLGFVPPARFFMPYRIPSATLDYLDATHLLFTFHVASLMHRELHDPAEDQDQTVRALVLNLPDGKVASEGTWRLHDRSRYLWTLGNGLFLLRQRDTLYISDKSLVLKDYLHPEGSLASVQVSPDGSTVVAQYAQPAPESEDGRPAGAPSLGAPSLGDDAPHLPSKPQQYSILVVNTRERKAARVGHVPHAVLLPMVEGGYLGVQPAKGRQWNVDLSSFSGDSRVVASVPSTCQPTVIPVSMQAFLALSCLPYNSNQLVDAFDLEGHKLWEQTWQSRFTWGTMAYSKAGNRFAYGSVEINHQLGALDPVDDASILGQPVGIFNLQSGKLDTVLDATPILTAGQNFALSPDGDHLAILRDGAIEVYMLPPIGPPAAVTAAAKHP